MMNEPRIDRLARTLAQGTTRRSLLKGLVGGLGLAGVMRDAVAARGGPGTSCDTARDCDSFHCVDGVCCDGVCCDGRCVDACPDA